MLHYLPVSMHPSLSLDTYWASFIQCFGKFFLSLLYYIQRKIFFRWSFFLYSTCHYMRAWILRVFDASNCYECVAWAERKSALQGSGLVRTVGPCAQRRVALMPRVIATARDALSNDRRESATRFERPAKQALVLATESRAKRVTRSVLCHIYLNFLLISQLNSA